MNLREPAGWERGKGNSAEFSVRARAGDGSGGNTRGTVRGLSAAGALSAYRECCVHRLSVGACLYRFFITKLKKWRTQT